MDLVRKVYAQREEMKKKNLLIATQAFIASSIILTPSLVHGEEHPHTPVFSDTIPYWINFLMYVGLLVLVLRKPISTGWSSRREGISSAVFKGKHEREQQKLRFTMPS